MYSSQQKKDILKSLDNILNSDGFTQAPQMQNFLKFVVHKTIENKSSQIKGYTIGVDALGRSTDFDPHTDPSVRVMVGRLRQSLKNYYAALDEENSPGKQSPQIHIPKGSYIPKFSFDTNARPGSALSISSPKDFAAGGIRRYLIYAVHYCLLLLQA